MVNVASFGLGLGTTQLGTGLGLGQSGGAAGSGKGKGVGDPVIGQDKAEVAHGCTQKMFLRQRQRVSETETENALGQRASHAERSGAKSAPRGPHRR